MSQPFLGEIKLLPYDWPPKGWTLCAGQLLAINSNQALFSLLGVTYGGDGIQTFGLPDLRGRTPMHPSTTYLAGKPGGTETVTLNVNELPAHNHAVAATTANGSVTGFQDNVLAAAVLGGTDPANMDGPSTSLVGLCPASMSNTGGGQPHANCQPSLVMNFCIATSGIFPSRN